MVSLNTHCDILTYAIESSSRLHLLVVCSLSHCFDVIRNRYKGENNNCEERNKIREQCEEESNSREKASKEESRGIMLDKDRIAGPFLIFVQSSESEEDDSSEEEKPKKRQVKKKKKKVESDSEESDSDDEPKKSKAKGKVKKEVKEEPKRKGKKKEGEEEGEGEWKWWEEEALPDGKKWISLVHNGVMFAEPYVPHGVKFYYDGNPLQALFYFNYILILFLTYLLIIFWQESLLIFRLRLRKWLHFTLNTWKPTILRKKISILTSGASLGILRPPPSPPLPLN